jgi:predicted RNase H-like HicB family nuclease
MTDTDRYPAQLFWSENDNGFIAVAPDLPGCSAFGETQHDALNELQDAIQAWMEAARAAHNPIPEPSPPVTDHQHSGKVLVRMPRGLHAQLTQSAKQEDVSLNQYIVYLLSNAGSVRTSAPPKTPKRSTSTVA